MKKNDMNFTIHFIERASERLDMNKKQAVRLGTLASERGKTSAELPKRERKYMEEK